MYFSSLVSHLLQIKLTYRYFLLKVLLFQLKKTLEAVKGEKWHIQTIMKTKLVHIFSGFLGYKQLSM